VRRAPAIGLVDVGIEILLCSMERDEPSDEPAPLRPDEADRTPADGFNMPQSLKRKAREIVFSASEFFS
jgi:hypothetical protein